MNFIRVGFLCFMIYSFIQGRIHIDQLASQLKEDREYFSDKGKFNEQLKNCVDSAKILAVDIANLTVASVAVIEDFHALYLTKSFLEDSSTENTTSHAA